MSLLVRLEGKRDSWGNCEFQTLNPWFPLKCAPVSTPSSYCIRYRAILTTGLLYYPKCTLCSGAPSIKPGQERRTSTGASEIWDWRRFLSAWERCKAKKGGKATWETFSKKCISYDKWNPSSNMRIICVQTGFPVTHLTEWKFMQNLRKCRSVLPHSPDLVWTSPPKKESTLNKKSILWSHLWQRSLQTKCIILCPFSSLTSWSRTGQPLGRPPQSRRDPPGNCCAKPCQQFLLRQRYVLQQRVVFFMTPRF